MPPSLSFCIIAKDAAATLEACLAGAKAVADEIVVVDTGSNDATEEVAKRLGARVYRYQWRDDFAAARNFALSKAGGQWVLFLDTDETLFPEDVPLLKELLSRTGVEAYFLVIHSLVDDRGRQVVSPALRLFRRRPQYRWQGRVHEQILPSIVAANQGCIEISGVRVKHFGYLAAQVASGDKIRRNLRLLQLELAERPHDPFVLFNLGVERQRAGELTEALASYEKARQNLDPAWSFASLLEKRRIDCLMALGRLEEALSACREAEAKFPAYTDLPFQEGLILGALGQLDAAKEALERCLAMGDAPPWFTSEKGVGSWRALIALARVCRQLGELEAAAQALLRVLQLGEGGEDEAFCALPEILPQLKATPWVEEGWIRLIRCWLQRWAQESRDLACRWPELKVLRQAVETLASPRPTLSLCLIVRDEEESLGRCLASAVRAVDDIVVVDTGSRDGTMAVAKQAGARVFSLPWPEDFARARNYALEQARGDWILVLDADEELQAKDIPVLRRLLWRQDVEAYCVRIANYYGSTAGPDFVTDNVCRLFRRRPEYRFRGIIHEQVIDSIREQAGPDSIRFTDVTILHYGYLDPRVRAKKKSARNRRLLEQARRQDPANPYWQYALAVEDFQEGKYQEALKQLSNLRLEQAVGYASDVAYKRAICLMELGRLEPALSWIDNALKQFPGFTDLLFLKAEILAKQGRWELAALAYQSCLQWGDASAHYSGVNGVGTFRAWHGLGLAWERLGQKEEAARAFREALKSNPVWLPPLYSLARVVKAIGGEQAVADELERLISPRRGQDYLRIADVLASVGGKGLAQKYLLCALPLSQSSRAEMEL